ncbi:MULTISPECIES: hypothetical protein [Duganella]|uniref:Uncharacterized protein n=2 Tax=Duganella TaxID=75654 RepID=A0A845GPA5_9BURK|nr:MULTISPECIES: hypothetical protein [Duganella]MYM80792.1 hypothetical protein [Duganella lactea]MYM96104.1 hypothetical protein [Duganella vulcania]
MELTFDAVRSTKLYSNLCAISSETGFHIAHNIKHPADILRLQFDKLNAALNEFLKSIEKNPFDKSKDAAICSYILSLDTFYDNLLLIIKAISPVAENDNSDVNIWLKSNKSVIYGEFLDSTSKAHAFVRKLSNKVKHDAVDVNYIQLSDHQGVAVEGFYLSNAVGERDLTGPDPAVHKSYKGSSTAISYNFFTLYSFGFVALTLFHLNRLIFSKQKAHSVAAPNLHSYFVRGANVHHRFFPNEYGEEFGMISDKKNVLSIKYPFKIKADKAYDAINGIRPTFKANQRTNSAHVEWPYFKLLGRITG